MGNAQAGHHRRGSKHLVTILQSDGRVLEFSRSLRVADLLYDHPDHFVCHSSALVLLQQGKMLPPDAPLMRGEVYFLLPHPKSNPAPAEKVSHAAPAEKVPHAASLAEADQKPARLQSAKSEIQPGRTMKVLITKQQLAKILAEGAVKMETRSPEPAVRVLESNSSSRSDSLRVLHRPAPPLMIKRAVTWSPGLESISEVPVM